MINRAVVLTMVLFVSRFFLHLLGFQICSIS